MKYLHTMIRVKDLDRALEFFVDKLGLVETRRHEVPEGKFTLVFLATAEDADQPNRPEVELTYNWGQEEEYTFGRNFGHLAYAVDDIHQKCAELMEKGVEILRPPRDGRMAFIKSPDNISVELLQKGEALTPCEPWISMENKGSW